MRVEDVKPDLAVIYIPRHAKGDPSHMDCEKGVVVRISGDGKGAFVRYYEKNGEPQTTPKHTLIKNLEPL